MYESIRRDSVNRLDENKKLGIKEVSLYLGRNRIETEEKVKTIRDNPEKYKQGLGIDATRAPMEYFSSEDYGSIAAAQIISKSNKEPQLIIVATETSKDLSESSFIGIKKRIEILTDKTIDPISLHVQSACVSGIMSIATLLNTNFEGNAIIITHDAALYKMSTGPDMTGGIGGTALELATGASDSDIIIERGFATTLPVPDFTKPVIIEDENDGKGKAFIYPIVYGTLSEYAYLLAVYKALKKAGIEEINNYEAFVNNYAIAGHIPYPKMLDKAVAYLLRHFARIDKETRDRLTKEMGSFDEPNIDNIETHEESLEIYIEFIGLYSNLLRNKEANKEPNIKLLKESIKEEIESISKKHNIKNGTLYNAIVKTLEEVDNSNNLNELIVAMNPVKGVFDEFISKDEAFMKKIRSTKIFKETREELMLDYSTALSKNTGNIYTGSSILSLASLILYAYQNEEVKEKLNKKKIIWIGYGSGSQAVVLIARASTEAINRIGKDIEEQLKAHEIITKNITAEEYKSIREKNAKDIPIGIIPQERLKEEYEVYTKAREEVKAAYAKKVKV